MPVACRSTTRLLADYDEARLKGVAKAGVRLHLAFCGDCSRYLEQLRAVRSALGSLAKSSVSDETKARLCERFRSWKATLPKGGT